MVSKINSTLNRIKLDGRIDKKDVEELVKVAADGKCITKAEAAALHKVRTTSPELFTKAAKDGFDNFLQAMDRSWSSTKEVHLPGLDDAKAKELLNGDPRIGIYSGRVSSVSCRLTPSAMCCRISRRRGCRSDCGSSRTPSP